MLQFGREKKYFVVLDVVDDEDPVSPLGGNKTLSVTNSIVLQLHIKFFNNLNLNNIFLYLH